VVDLMPGAIAVAGRAFHAFDQLAVVRLAGGFGAIGATIIAVGHVLSPSGHQ
jgi:hypothetical protein